jgi:hypothetical protein
VRVLYVRILAPLVAAAQQQVERFAGSRVVHAVPRAEIYSQLTQALADRPDIARIAVDRILSL